MTLSLYLRAGHVVEMPVKLHNQNLLVVFSIPCVGESKLMFMCHINNDLSDCYCVIYVYFMRHKYICTIFLPHITCLNVGVTTVYIICTRYALLGFFVECENIKQRENIRTVLPGLTKLNFLT